MWRGEKSLPQPGIELRFRGYPVCSIVTILTELTWLRRICHKCLASGIASVQLLTNITRNVTQPLVSRLSCDLIGRKPATSYPVGYRMACCDQLCILSLENWSHTHLLASSSFLYRRMTEEDYKNWTGSFRDIALDLVFGRCLVWIPVRTPAVLNKSLVVFLSSSRKTSGQYFH
jgi:hypothetical protein